MPQELRSLRLTRQQRPRLSMPTKAAEPHDAPCARATKDEPPPSPHRDEVQVDHASALEELSLPIQPNILFSASLSGDFVIHWCAVQDALVLNVVCDRAASRQRVQRGRTSSCNSQGRVTCFSVRCAAPPHDPHEAHVSVGFGVIIR